jgi:hypothetical protein
MHYCEVELVGLTSDQCGEPAGIRIEGRWLCEHHADALERDLARWADPEWITEQLRKVEE